MNVQSVRRAVALLDELECARRDHEIAVDTTGVSIQLRKGSANKIAFEYTRGSDADGFEVMHDALVAHLFRRVQSIELELRELGVTP